MRDSQLHVEPSGKWIEEDDLGYEINEPDAYALEEALQLKEKHGGEVIVLCAGPERAAQTIREALAKGADRAIHVDEENPRRWDTLGCGAAAGRGRRNGKARSCSNGTAVGRPRLGQTGVVMAELLGLPHATLVMQVEVRTAACA